MGQVVNLKCLNLNKLPYHFFFLKDKFMNNISAIIESLNIKNVEIYSNKDKVVIKNLFFKITIKKIDHSEVYLFKKWNLSIFGELILKKKYIEFTNVYNIVSNSLINNHIVINKLNFFPNY